MPVAGVIVALQNVATHGAESALPPRALCFSCIFRCCSFFHRQQPLWVEQAKASCFTQPAPAFGSWPGQVVCAAQAGCVGTGSLNEKRRKKQGTMAFCSYLEVMDTAPGTCSCAVLQHYRYVSDSALELVIFNIIWFGLFFLRDWINYLNKRNKLISLLSAVLRILLPWSQRLDLFLESDIKWIKICQTSISFCIAWFKWYNLNCSFCIFFTLLL